MLRFNTALTHNSKHAMRAHLFSLCFASVACGLCAPLAASNAGPSSVIDPAEIDRAVRDFTGAEIGAIGGARTPSDARLRLASCAQPLTLSWYGTTRAAVQVECPQTRASSGPWKIFVATRPPPQVAAPIAKRPSPAAAAPVIKRGDPITVLVRGRGFTVQQAGEAMEAGGVGDWIGIRTARQAEPVRARIERPGLAVIPVN